ncbi:MAG TPA: nuclear transport factor 2 family protein [Thermoanaerobaculia bacterium]|nr:nuclear transport factor 2 family protein [Thermoanaerobaculia bacterium]
MRRALILFLLVAAAALPLPARTEAGRELSDAEAFVEQYLSTFNAADPVALAGLYAEDGLVLPPAGGSVRGREAIRKFWSNSSRRSLSFNMLQKNVCGETGFFVGTYTARENRSGRFYPASPFVLLGRSGQTGKPSPISGNFTLCVRRGDDGQWRVASDMWTEAYWVGFVPAGREGGSIVPAREPGR